MAGTPPARSRTGLCVLDAMIRSFGEQDARRFILEDEVFRELLSFHLTEHHFCQVCPERIKDLFPELGEDLDLSVLERLVSELAEQH